MRGRRKLECPRPERADSKAQLEGLGALYAPFGPADVALPAAIPTITSMPGPIGGRPYHAHRISLLRRSPTHRSAHMRSGRLHTERRVGSCPAIHGMGGDGLDALIVRDARPDDRGFVQRMLYEAVNRPGTDWPTFEDCMEEPRNRRHWIGLMTRSGDRGVVAELARRPVGAAWVRRMRGNELRPLDDPAVPVLAIAVESEYRGRGIGGRLMTALLDRARDAGTSAIDLDTGSFNEAAVRLYHSQGFVDTGHYGEGIRMRIVLD
jgi:ribosomal protein S18 acetylase RimI-like enzyme